MVINRVEGCGVELIALRGVGRGICRFDGVWCGINRFEGCGELIALRGVCVN